MSIGLPLPTPVPVPRRGCTSAGLDAGSVCHVGCES
jgi:hypothetical protein